MNDPCSDRLSDYLDGELDAADQAALERHLQECTPCRTLLAELRAVVDRARALGPIAPARDLWAGVRQRIADEDATTNSVGRRSRPPTLTFTLPQLAAAAIALILATSGTVAWLSGVAGSKPAPAPVASVAPAVPVARWQAAAHNYESAMRDLEQVLAERRHRLKPETVTVLERNLRTIDRALDQAWRALAADPGDPYLNQHLAATMRRKLALLRTATAIQI
jgi:anti-sigma factor RsiW